MCLSSRHDPQTTQAILPKKPFYAYKWVSRSSDGRLTSPVYTHKEWKPGENVASGRNRGNGDSGMYLFLVPPGKALASSPHQAILRMIVDPKDVVASGPDSNGGHSGTCVVCRKATVSQEDYDAAVAGKTTQLTSAELDRAEKTKKAAKKAVERQDANAEKVRKKTAKKVRATAKKVAKTAKKAKKLATKKKKTAKPAARKVPKGVKAAKRAAKKVVKPKKATRSAVKPVKKSRRQELSDMTVADLRALAKNLGVVGFSRMTKDDLVTTLERKRSGVKKKKK